MKYIKSFNEELSPHIYKRAASQLRSTYGHHKRADKLEDYADDIYKKQELKRIENNRERFSKFGSFQGRLKVIHRDKSWKITSEEFIEGNFFVSIWFDDDWFKDMVYESFISEGFQYSVALPIDFDVMAADEETTQKVIDSGVELNDGMIFSNRLEMGYIRYDNNSKEYIVDPKHFSFYDRDQNSDFHFLTRADALKFKKLFVGAMLGQNDFGVTNGWVKYPTLKDHIKSALENQNCLTDDGISLINPEEDLVKLQNSAKLLSLNILYKD